MPRVVVDGFHLGNDSSFRGIGTYLRNVLARLASTPGMQVSVLARDPKMVPANATVRRVHQFAPNRWSAAEHELRLPWLLAKVPGDVVWSPAQDPPRRCPRPWVQTLLDTTPLVFEANGLESERARMLRQAPRIRSATAVIAISRHSAADGVRHLGLDPAKVVVAHLGVDEQFRPAAEDADAPPVVLCVGEYGPHKGFSEAFATIGAIADAGLPHRLRMIARLAPWHEPVVRSLVAAAPHPERIELAGYVDDIVAEYQRADAVIVTSRNEGFCLPALEAMACGTPVIAFDNSALPEVVGDAGILVPDGDVPAMVERLRALLTDRRQHEELSVAAVERARTFTWDRCAAVHAEVLASAAA